MCLDRRLRARVGPPGRPFRDGSLALSGHKSACEPRSARTSGSAQARERGSGRESERPRPTGPNVPHDRVAVLRPVTQAGQDEQRRFGEPAELRTLRSHSGPPLTTFAISIDGIYAPARRMSRGSTEFLAAAPRRVQRDGATIDPRVRGESYKADLYELTAHAKARGWDAVFGAGIVRLKEGQSGRGERHSPATNDLPINMRLAAPPELFELRATSPKRSAGSRQKTAATS